MRAESGVKRALTYVLVVVAIVAASQVVLDEVLGASPVYVVVSSSMVPTLKIGDLVFAERVPFSSIHVGDVIIYATPTPDGRSCGGLVVVHRVVGIASNGGLVTQGDNRATNPLPDEPYNWPYVQANCVRGEVVLAVPYLGLVSMMFPPPTNYILVAIILVVVFLTELRGKESPETPREGVSNAVGLPGPFI